MQIEKGAIILFHGLSHSEYIPQFGVVISVLDDSAEVLWADKTTGTIGREQDSDREYPIYTVLRP